MGKVKKLSKKELKKAQELFDSKKGIRAIMFRDGEKLYPFCIICGKILKGQFLQGLWVEPEFTKTYAYAVCLEHQNDLTDEDTINEIEEKLMLLVASDIPRFKL